MPDIRLTPAATGAWASGGAERTAGMTGSGSPVAPGHSAACLSCHRLIYLNRRMRQETAADSCEPAKLRKRRRTNYENSHSPASMTVSPCWLSVRNRAVDPSTHMETVNVSPG